MTPASGGRFSWRQRGRSLAHALRGLGVLVASEHNARIHLVSALLVVLLAAGLRVRLEDWRWLLLCIFAVWIAEAFNTAVERLCDRVSLAHHPLIRDAKDIAAAAVLLSCAGAVGAGGMTLWPYLTQWWRAWSG
jgi:diacylglycerol kinase (ATP)